MKQKAEPSLPKEVTDIGKLLANVGLGGNMGRGLMRESMHVV